MSWRAAVGRSMASLKIMACPESGSSAAARCVPQRALPIHSVAEPLTLLKIYYFISCRAFWANNYQTVKQMNPTFPFMIRAAVNTPTPYMIVEYGACNYQD